jgi:ribosomal protein L11 methyltransferase
VIRLAVRVSGEHAELVLAELLELTPAGVEEVQLEGGVVEYAVYGSPGELPGLPDLNALVGEAPVEVSTSEIPDDWSERWKQFHRPVLIAAPTAARHADAPPIPALHVRPPWEPPSSHADGPVREIVIDPGQAFGTGAHASTRLCLQLLMELVAAKPPGGPLLDIGTGSGVLAIAAATLGYEPVLGLDHERESVHAARENAAVNAVQLEARRFELRTQALPWIGDEALPRAPLVVLANLLRPLLLELAITMPEAPADLIVGGLLCEEVDEIVLAFGERHALRERERRSSGEWAAAWLTR